MKILAFSNSITKISAVIVFISCVFSSYANCADTNLDFGFPSFESFASSGAQVASATDGGALFINPAALQNQNSYLLSHSFAGYEKMSVFGIGRSKIESQSPWSALGVAWRPDNFLGRLILGAGYYTPNTISVDQPLEPSGFGMFNTWANHMRLEIFSRRSGIGASYLVSPRWSFGASCSGVWRTQQWLVFGGSDSSFPLNDSTVSTSSFSVTKIFAQNIFIEGIAGVRFNINENFFVGAAWEAPVKVISAKSTSSSYGVAGAINTDSTGKVSANNNRINSEKNDNSSSLKFFPQQQRVGISWQEDGTLISVAVNRRSGFTTQDNEIYSQTVDWSGAVRYSLVPSAAAFLSMRTNYNAVLNNKRSVGGGAVELRGGGSFRFGDTEFALGLSYVRNAEEHVMDFSRPEDTVVLQGLFGINSYFK